MLLGGCATQHQHDQNSDQNPSLPAYLVYGKLEETAEGYIFTEFSEGFTQTEPWVRLADMKPMWNTEQEDCDTGLAEMVDEFSKFTCKTEDKSLFRDKAVHFTVGKTATYMLVSAFTMGLSATMPPAAVKFDKDKYQSAVNQAEESLIVTFSPLSESYRQYLENYSTDMVQFDQQYEEIVSSYSRAKAVPNIDLVDESGLFDGNASDFKYDVTISGNSLIPRGDIEQISAITLYDFIESAQKRSKDSIEVLRKATATLVVTCENRSLAHYLSYTVSCEEEVDSSSTDFEVRVVIKSISYKDVMPDYIFEEDENVSLIFKKGRFHLTNKSDSYITVDSLSFYHNGKIATSSDREFEFAPQSEAELMPMAKLPLHKSSIEFPNTTKTSASKLKVKYGVAVKYRVVNTNKEITLFRTRAYPLLDLI
jgi:hypothetical protein